MSEILEIIIIENDDKKFKQKTELKKQKDIINEIHNFNNRELYMIDSNYCFDISSIIIKDNCLLIKLDYVRAIIFSQKVYLFENKNESIILDLNENKHGSYLIHNEYSNNFFHLFILDYFFTNISNQFLAELSEITPKISTYNENIKNGDYSYNKFIIQQSELTSLEYRIKELKSLTSELADNRDDINNLRLGNIQIPLSNVEEMMENYSLKFQDLENDVNRLRRETDNIQKIVNINLALKRNNYAIVSIYISIISVSISLGSFIGSMFGMNLINHQENNPYSFYIIFSSSVLFCFLAGIIQLYIFTYKNV
jgi:Mg2+ and Co2+ transporter CorA